MYLDHALARHHHPRINVPPQSVFAEFDRILKDEARKKDEQDRKEGKPTPQEEAEWYAPFILGQEVFFVAQENARVPGEITRGVIVEPNMKTIDNPDRDTKNIYVTVRTADSPKVGFPIAKNRLKLSAEELIDRDEQLKQSAQPYLFKKDGTLYGQKMSMLIDQSTKKPIRIFADGPGKGRKVPDNAPMNIVDENAWKLKYEKYDEASRKYEEANGRDTRESRKRNCGNYFWWRNGKS